MYIYVQGQGKKYISNQSVVGLELLKAPKKKKVFT